MKETKYDLEILTEAEELVRIFAASIRTAESNREPREKS